MFENDRGLNFRVKWNVLNSLKINIVSFKESQEENSLKMAVFQ